VSEVANPRPAPSRRRILGATVLALVVAGVSLVVFVLPAEYGVDPLGTGAALGLLALAEPERQAMEAAPGPYAPDAVSFELQPFESIEYKYRLEEGDSLVFSWRASGEVVSELHAEPDGAPEGFAESFEKARAAERHGGYRAPFPGWHGWFWENRGMDAVIVTLEASGFFSAARTYRGGHVWEEDKGVARREVVPASASR
jgi:hypothetical protein